jgi:hypothetical protein
MKPDTDPGADTDPPSCGAYYQAHNHAGQELAERNDMNIINRTPHAINVTFEAPSHFGAPADTEMRTLSFPVTGEPIRALAHYGPTPDAEDVPCVSPPRITGVRGHDDLPRGAAVLVSMLAAKPLAALRRDLQVFSPGEEIRDENGRIVGCKNLVRWGCKGWVSDEDRHPMTHRIWAPQEPANPAGGGWYVAAEIVAAEESRWLGDSAPKPQAAGQSYANLLRVPVLVTRIDQTTPEVYPTLDALMDGAIHPDMDVNRAARGR